jgi:hypothetical protein
VSNTAGQQFKYFYPRAVEAYPLLHRTLIIAEDLSSLQGPDGDAWCSGVDLHGSPIVQCRADFTLDENTAMHEVGHAMLYTLRWWDASIDYLAHLWDFMFKSWPSAPRTWQEARAESEKQTSYYARWQLEPIELWAEVAGMALSGGWTRHSNSTVTGCKANDYGRLVLPADAITFFHDLRRKIQADPVLEGWQRAGEDANHTQFFWVNDFYLATTDVFGSIMAMTKK